MLILKIQTSGAVFFVLFLLSYSYADSYAHFGELSSEPSSTSVIVLCGLYIMAITIADALNFDRRI